MVPLLVVDTAGSVGPIASADLRHGRFRRHLRSSPGGGGGYLNSAWGFGPRGGVDKGQAWFDGDAAAFPDVLRGLLVDGG